MTVTSIGYGDIAPVRFEEYIVCILCMLLGGVLWAYIIGCTCSLLTSTSRVEQNFEQNTDLLNVMMKTASVPWRERQKYREFLRVAKVQDARLQFVDVAQNFSPILRGALLLHISRKRIEQAYYFRKATELVIMEVANGLRSHFFSRGEPLLSIRYRLCLVERGTIAHGGMILSQGHAFQTDFIIAARALQELKHSVTLSYAQLLVLDRQTFDVILQSHPRFQKYVWREATKLATLRAIKYCAKKLRELEMATNNGKLALTLVEAFDCLDLMQTGKGDGTGQMISLERSHRLSEGIMAGRSTRNGQDQACEDKVVPDAVTSLLTEACHEDVQSI